MTEIISSNPIVIKPAKGWVPLNHREFWSYRELLYFLVWRDVKVRYKQTVIGIAWAVLQPLASMLIFTLIFGMFAKIPSDGLPYPVFAFCALLPWTLFSRALTDASTSLVSNERIISKVYFPRLIVPTSAVLAGLVDFSISFVILLGIMAVYGILPTLAILTLPFFTILTLMTALGIGFWLCALDVMYRDVRYTLPFLTQLWFFATPVVYPASIVPEAFRWIYGLNPMAGVIEGFRWALLGKSDAPGPIVFISIAMVFCVFIGGLYFFRRMEKNFSDNI